MKLELMKFMWIWMWQYLSRTFFHILDDHICKVYPLYVIVRVPLKKKKKKDYCNS